MSAGLGGKARKVPDRYGRRAWVPGTRALASACVSIAALVLLVTLTGRPPGWLQDCYRAIGHSGACAVTTSSPAWLLVLLLLVGHWFASRHFWRDTDWPVLVKFRWKLFGFCLLATSVVNFVVFVPISLFSSSALSSLQNAGQFAPLALIIGIGIQAVGEEVLFRGHLFKSGFLCFRNRAFAVGASLALFSLGHIGRWDAFAAALAVGVAATLVTLKTGGLEAAIAIHFVHNVVMFGLDPFESATSLADRIFALTVTLTCICIVVLISVQLSPRKLANRQRQPVH